MSGSFWREMPLGDFVTLQRGHDLPDRDRRAGAIPILGSFGITGFHDEAKATGPGVTVGRSGASFGVVTYSAQPYWPLNTALFVRDFHGNDERFAYYFLQCFDFKKYNSGSAQPSLNRNYVHPVTVTVPPLSEQRAIAQILGSLDDRISMSLKTTTTLESMSRALFDSWFIRLEPCKANREGGETGLRPAVAALFSSDLASNGLPEGWATSSIYALAEVIYGAPFSSLQFNSDHIGKPLIRKRLLRAVLTAIRLSRSAD